MDTIFHFSSELAEYNGYENECGEGGGRGGSGSPHSPAALATLVQASTNIPMSSLTCITMYLHFSLIISSFVLCMYSGRRI